MLTSPVRGGCLGFAPAGAEPLRTSHPARLCGSASLWGPAARSVSAQSCHCPAPPLSPSVTCLFRCAFSPLSCSSQPGRAAAGGASELTSHLLHLREKSSLFPPLPRSNLFHNDGKMLLPKAQTPMCSLPSCRTPSRPP